MEGQDGTPMSRCFVVCGKAITVSVNPHRRLLFLFPTSITGPPYAEQNEDLQAAFAPYGNIQSVKVIREKGGGEMCCKGGSDAHERLPH